MAGVAANLVSRQTAPRRATADAPLAKALLIAFVFGVFLLFLIFPLFVIFKEAFSRGVPFFLQAFTDRTALHSIWLTLITAAIAVPLNTAFGVMAAWAVTRFEFRGRSLLISLIDLPLWVSPVIGGLIYVLVFGRHGWLGPWLDSVGIRVVFALPGIVLATTFVTFPFVARGLIPLMQAQGYKEEEAAMTLGANGWQIFWRVTLPKVKWGLIYGVILCNARSMGEFGAVSVISGSIQNQTTTMPLQIEIFYNEYPNTWAFVLAVALSVLALVTLMIKTYVEWQAERQLRAASETP